MCLAVPRLQFCLHADVVSHQLKTSKKTQKPLISFPSQFLLAVRISEASKHHYQFYASNSIIYLAQNIFGTRFK